MIEVDEEGLVLGLHEHLVEKTAARVALGIEDAGLTAAGVDQQAEREREIRLLRKILDGLRAAVFLKREIVFGEVADDLAMVVAYGYGQRDYFDIDRECGSGSIVLTLRLRRLGGSRKNDQHDD